MFRLRSLFDDKQLGMSGVMVGKRYRHAHVAAIEAEAANLAPQYVPLVSKDVRLTPAGDTRFFRGDPLIAYFELYEPLLTELNNAIATGVQAHVRIVNSGGMVVKDFPAFSVSTYEQAGSDVIPVAREVPFKSLPRGAYTLQVQGADSVGHSTAWRSADFSIE